MSYLLARQKVRSKDVVAARARRGHAGLGDDDDFKRWCAENYNTIPGFACRAMYPDGPPTVASEAQKCIDAGNVITAPLDAKTTDIGRTWNPPDTLSPTEVRTIVSAAMEVLRQAQWVVDKAKAEPNAIQSDLKQATDDLIRHGAQAVDYTLAANAADAAGVAVSAPGMKKWVMDTMNASSNAMVVAYVAGCTTPWFVMALAIFQRTFDTLYGIAKSVVGVVIAIGEKVVKAVEGAFDVVAWIEKWGPIAAVGLGALWIATRHKKPARSGSLA